MLGVPEGDWPNLTKVAKLVIHLFKQQLLGVTEHSAAEVRAFETVMRYLKSLTDRLLAPDPDARLQGARDVLDALELGVVPPAEPAAVSAFSSKMFSTHWR